MGALHLADQPFPHREGLGVRIVDAEYPHAFGYPVIEYALQLDPQRAPVRGFEVEGIDILVFFRRVLGVLHAAIGTVPEPLGVRGYVRVVRGALECDVERYLDALRARGAHQPAKILRRSELGVYGLVAAFARADCPRAARVARRRGDGVVATLASCHADGVYGREIEHVEAHGRDVGEPRLAIPERAVARTGGGAWKHLVPAAETR